MAIFQRQPRSRDDTTAINGAVDTAEKGSAYGSLPATILSAVAVGISCISFYLSVLQGPALEVYVPPTIHYGRDAGGETELFAIPITIANDGARSGTVISMELEVQNLKTNNAKRYYSAFVGEHPRETAAPNRQFAPLSIPGRAVFSETVRFYPTGNALPRLIDAEGEYAFRLQLHTATPPTPSLLDRPKGRTQPAPIVFQMTLPWISDQQLGSRRATIAMHAKDWKPTVSAAP
jgi:hypothetical protein